MYLLVCSFYLTVKAFANIPNLLKGLSPSEVAKTFISGPVGTLIAAAVSTFGIYFIASFLYVSRRSTPLCRSHR